MAQWLDATVARRVDWNDHLFSLVFDCPEFPSFKAGQFTKIGIELEEGKVLSRPYSLVNAPSNPQLEIIAVPVEGGSLSPQLHTLRQGDRVKVMSPPTGYLVLDEVPTAETLWMIATGTGVGPYLSMLETEQLWQSFDNVALVYAVRLEQDLAYLDQIRACKQHYQSRFSFVPIISREQTDYALHGRIPALLEQDKLQQAAGRTLTADNSQVMLCGNPDMIKDTMNVLKGMGLSRHLRRSPGQITLEQYW